MTLPRSSDNAAVGLPAPRPRPLTDPADIMTLLGRFMACGVLFILTIVAFATRHLVLGLALAVFSLIWQRATTNLWRRLRDERIAAEAAREAETVETVGTTVAS